MSGQRLVFFDLETGGLDPQRHPVTQFAAIAVDDRFEELGSLELKLDFDAASADPEALRLNGYDPSVWRADAVSVDVALRSIADFMKKHATVEKVSQRNGKPYRVARLAGHNAAEFDARFLQALFKRGGAFLPAEYRALDTVQLAAWHFLHRAEAPENLKLETLVGHFGIQRDGSAHDALSDVRACVELARRILSSSQPASVEEPF